MSVTPWLIYGAYGYTGEALARRAVAEGEAVVLAGRRAEALAPLGEELGCEVRAFSLDDPAACQAGLEGVDLVAHCAGPFSATAAPMRSACLEAGVHYLDITGEINVFADSHAADAAAREKGVVVMSGTGFDVVPTDCLAAYLKGRLPTARRLEMAFHSTGGVSKGTSKTMLEGVGQPGWIRKDGKLTPVPVAWKDRVVPFSCGPRTCVSIPWGDVCTAYFTTGIPNITVYMDMAPGAIRTMRWTRWLHGAMAWGPIQGLLQSWVDRNVTGPSPEVREKARSYLWGRVEDDEGGAAEATMVTPEGYRLTVLATLEIARRVRAGACEPGAWTPAAAFGPDLILDFPDTTRTDRDLG